MSDTIPRQGIYHVAIPSPAGAVSTPNFLQRSLPPTLPPHPYPSILQQAPFPNLDYPFLSPPANMSFLQRLADGKGLNVASTIRMVKHPKMGIDRRDSAQGPRPISVPQTSVQPGQKRSRLPSNDVARKAPHMAGTSSPSQNTTSGIPFTAQKPPQALASRAAGPLPQAASRQELASKDGVPKPVNFLPISRGRNVMPRWSDRHRPVVMDDDDEDEVPGSEGRKSVPRRAARGRPVLLRGGGDEEEDDDETDVSDDDNEVTGPKSQKLLFTTRRLPKPNMVQDDDETKAPRDTKKVTASKTPKLFLKIRKPSKRPLSKDDDERKISHHDKRATRSKTPKLFLKTRKPSKRDSSQDKGDPSPAGSAVPPPARHERERPRPHYNYPPTKDIEGMQRLLGPDDWSEYLMLVELKEMGMITEAEYAMKSRRLFSVMDEATRRGIEKRMSKLVGGLLEVYLEDEDEKRYWEEARNARAAGEGQ